VAAVAAPLPGWQDEAAAAIAAMLPAACDLDVQPSHVCGVGLEGLSMAQLEALEVSAVLCCAALCCAVLCCAVLCCAVLCCAVLCCAVWLPAVSVAACVSSSMGRCKCTLCSQPR
jgi:hypothetical protein